MSLSSMSDAISQPEEESTRPISSIMFWKALIFAVPVKWDNVGSLVGLIDAADVVIFDST